MGTIGQDLRYALRSLRKSPGFAIIAAVTLGLGIGATATIFSCLNALLIRPFPFAEPERIVAIRETNLRRGWTGNEVSYPNFVDWRTQASSFVDLGASPSAVPNTGPFSASRAQHHERPREE